VDPLVSANSKLPEICEAVFTKAREKLGLSAKELGVLACLSTRQIEQIENGETNSFYSAQIKVTAAKKVAKLLNLSDEEAFDYSTQAPKKMSVAPAELPIAELKTTSAPSAEDLQIAEEKKEPADNAQSKEPQVKVASSIEVSAKKQTAPQKKLFLWASVAAAAVFAVVNVQPLFFADKPEETVLVKEAPVETAPATASTPTDSVAVPTPTPLTTPTLASAGATTTTNASSGACPVEEGIISFKPEAPRKVADMVFVQTKAQQVICVIDASGKTQNKLVEPGVGASFYGKPPFKVLTAGLNQVDVFFQGAKVRLANLNTKTLILEASEVLIPTPDRSDSQLR
jgi:transcriptional regulator with XRE-family HTH domain